MTPDESVADKLGKVIDSRIAQLKAEYSTLEDAASRMKAIDMELAVLFDEQKRINERRPKSLLKKLFS